MKFTFDEKKFRLHAQALAKKSFTKIADSMQEKITEEVRQYPGITIRRYGEGKTGRIAGSPRDVVDSGDLRDSYTTVIETIGDQIVFKAFWSTPYASLIYLGTSKIPAYAWVEMTLQQTNLSTVFEK
jgi:hypothetical protein